MINEIIFVFPLLIIIPLTLKLFSINIFSNIEFKTQTFKYLRLNSIIDVLTLISSIFIPLAFYQEFFSKWWPSNYGAIFYQLYVTLYLDHDLCLLNTIFNFIVICFQFKNFKNKLTSGRLFYFIVLISFVFSLTFHLPNLFLIEISFKNESLNNTIYCLKVKNRNYFHKFILIEYLLSFLFLLLTLILSLIVGFKIRKQKIAKFQSIIYTSKRHAFGSRMSFDCKIVANSTSKKHTSLYESKTAILSTFATFISSIEQALKLILNFITVAFKINFERSISILIYYYVIIILSQLFQVFIYYTFNKAFSRRFNKYFSCCKAKTDSI